MKFSPDGTKIATVLSGLSSAEVLDFDATTGVISSEYVPGPIAYLYPYVYGITFSPNSLRLYVSEENDPSLY